MENGMIFSLSDLAERGRFTPWNNFHDCTIAKVYTTNETCLFVIEDLYDWDARLPIDAKALLCIRSVEARRVSTDPEKICREIYWLELDTEKCNIKGTFIDYSFEIMVDINESFLVVL
jgi:hypothetical protein